MDIALLQMIAADFRESAAKAEAEANRFRQLGMRPERVAERLEIAQSNRVVVGRIEEILQEESQGAP